MNEVRLVLVGFGNVGRAFARLLQRKSKLLASEYGMEWKITGIATGRHGMAIDPQGVDVDRAVALVESGMSLDVLNKGETPADMLGFIQACPGDILFENSPVNYDTGQPAISHLQAALEKGMHAVTANKGPVVHAFNDLTQLARKMGKQFRFESTVMDGAPIFSLHRSTLPGAELLGFTGILNSCTNLLLERMESGETLDEAVKYGASIGITETDPSGDIDGWDASIKVAALSTVLMGIPLKPQDVEREGIRSITPAMLAEAKQAGERWKLVCRAQRNIDGIRASVKPERVSSGSPLYSVSGTSSFVVFETDVLPGLGVLESDPGPETTAFGLLADMLNIYQPR